MSIPEPPRAVGWILALAAILIVPVHATLAQAPPPSECTLDATECPTEPPSVSITSAPALTTIGDTVSLSASVSPPGGTLQWSVIHQGQGTFTAPNSTDTDLFVEDRSFAFDGEDGPNVTVLAQYTTVDSDGIAQTAEDMVKIPVDLENPLIPFVSVIAFTVNEDPSATLPLPGQSVTLHALVTPPAGDVVDFVDVSPSVFTLPNDVNDIFTVPITVTASINGGSQLFSWDTFAVVITDIINSIRIHLVLRKFDLYCLLFPGSEFCDVWNKAKEHLFGPGGGGVGSDNMREGWLAWADANTVRIHADGWDRINAGAPPIRDVLKGGVVNMVTPSLKEFLVHEIRHVWQFWQLAKGNPLPDGPDLEVDARWFSSRWSIWTLETIVQEILDQLQRVLEAIGTAVDEAISGLIDLFATAPAGPNFTDAVRQAAIDELTSLFGSEMIAEEDIPATLAAFDAVFLDNPPSRCPDGKTLEGPFTLTNSTGQPQLHVTAEFAGTGGTLMAPDFESLPDSVDQTGIMAEQNLVEAWFGSPGVQPGDSIKIVVCSEFPGIELVSVTWTGEVVEEVPPSEEQLEARRIAGRTGN